MTKMATFPSEFADLEPFADWVFAKERQRYDKRLTSSFEELQEMYNVVAPRARDAMTYLDHFDLEDLTDEQLNLLRLLYALSTISFAVDCFKQPKIPDSGATYLDWIEEPIP